MKNINIQSNLGHYADKKEPGSYRAKKEIKKRDQRNILEYKKIEVDKDMEPYFNTNLHINGMPQIIHTDPVPKCESKEMI